jgi:hypothetical protein
MDGAIAEGKLTCGAVTRTGGVRFEIATRDQDVAIRQLLRNTPMAGAISVSMEREPSYFDAAEIEGADHRAIIAVEDDRVIAVGGVSVRQRFINGQPMPVGYLSGLRLDASCRGRMSVISGGYKLLHDLHRQGGPPLYLTSIVADNFPARRLLERGLDGMPTYRFLGEFVTLIIGRRRLARKRRKSELHIRRGDEQTAPAIVDLLNRCNRQYQFAPVYQPDDLRVPGLHFEDFRVASASDGMPAACAALWDQRKFRQTIVRGYSPGLRRARPLINLAAASLGRPRLPVVGQPISLAFISHVAVDPKYSPTVDLLKDLLQAICETSPTNYLSIGFDARDPRLAQVRGTFRAREYVSRLYAVHWDDGAKLAQELDGSLLAPEVALL